jgi:hypothetical protein
MLYQEKIKMGRHKKDRNGTVQLTVSFWAPKEALERFRDLCKFHGIDYGVGYGMALKAFLEAQKEVK